MAASAPTAHAAGFPAEGRCGYYVAKKKRFCRMVVAAGKRFCGEHAGAAEVWYRAAPGSEISVLACTSSRTGVRFCSLGFPAFFRPSARLWAPRSGEPAGTGRGDTTRISVAPELPPLGLAAFAGSPGGGLPERSPLLVEAVDRNCF